MSHDHGAVLPVRASRRRRQAAAIFAAVIGMLAVAVVTVIPTGGAGATASTAATGAACPGRSPYATDPGQFVASHHPLILVHGWNSSSDAMGGVETGLTKLMPDTFDFRYFDYRQHSLDWAARPGIAACLADYVNEVSQHYRDAGGDGKVFLVAHSMGGLAIRFATDPNTVQHPVPGSEIGGIVTIDTPHTGSIFGNTWQAQLVQWAKAHLPGSQLSPDSSSDAGKCLALHDNQARSLPTSCPTPPYLPANTRLDEIAGTTTVQRTLFGVHLYDIPLNSDGVVSVDSSHGYLTSGPHGTKAPRTISELDTVTCTVTSDQTVALLRAAAKGKSLPTAIINAEVKALSILWKDGDILDALNAGRLTPDIEVMLGTELFFYPCGHTAMSRNPDALHDAANALSDDLVALHPPTLAAIMNATVPSLCGHPAGKFVNGVMRLPASQGYEDIRTGADMYAAGDLTGDGVGDAAVVLSCNAGGVGWPDTIVFFGPGPKVLGQFDMGKIVGDARGGTTSITYDNATIVVHTLDSRYGDPGCCASGSAIFTLKWNGAKIALARVQHLVGPTDITFTSIGPVHLGMSRTALSDLGYTGTQDTFGCWNFAAPGRPYVTWAPHGGVVAITPGSDKYQTYLGGIRTDGFSLLDTVLHAYHGYRVERHLHGDFGQASDGIAIHGPGGVIGMSVTPSPGTSTDDTLRSVTGIKIGSDATYASNEEFSCS